MKINKECLMVKVDLPDKQISEDINQELQDFSVDDAFGISEAMGKQASRYMRWADLLNKAKRVLTTLERDFDMWNAKALKKIREVLIRKEGNSKPTIKDLQNGVMIYFAKSQKEWNDKIDKARDNVNTLDIVVRATVVKQNMLVSIGQLCSRLIDSSNLVVKEKKISQRRD